MKRRTRKITGIRSRVPRAESLPGAVGLIDVRLAARRPWVPAASRLRAWVSAAIEGAGLRARPARRGMPVTALSLCIQVVGTRAGRRLNARWRDKDRATNVLSFPGPGRLSSGEWLLGDIVICAPVLAREARQQGKSLEAHWAHIVIHGVLHLLGFDHERPRQARQMEDLEVQILEGIGFSDPYGPF